jgi:hypothetical protein
MVSHRDYRTGRGKGHAQAAAHRCFIIRSFATDLEPHI